MFGLNVVNANAEIIIDSTYNNYVLENYGTLQVQYASDLPQSVYSGSFGVLPFSITSDMVVALKPVTDVDGIVYRSAVIFGTPMVRDTLLVSCGGSFSNRYKNIEYAVFRKTKSTDFVSSGVGLQINDAGGNPVFSSNKNQFHIHDAHYIRSLFYPLSSSTLPTGKYIDITTKKSDSYFIFSPWSYGIWKYGSTSGSRREYRYDIRMRRISDTKVRLFVYQVSDEYLESWPQNEVHCPFDSYMTVIECSY